jgi:hypothetical protein
MTDYQYFVPRPQPDGSTAYGDTFGTFTFVRTPHGINMIFGGFFGFNEVMQAEMAQMLHDLLDGDPNMPAFIPPAAHSVTRSARAYNVDAIRALETQAARRANGSTVREVRVNPTTASAFEETLSEAIRTMQIPRLTTKAEIPDNEVRLYWSSVDYVSAELQSEGSER